MTKKQQQQTFLVLFPIWSTQHQAYFNPGDTVTFDLSTDQTPDLPLLVAEKILEPMEVSNATDKSSNSDS